jgi:primosomal protein N' (replication factor Y)
MVQSLFSAASSDRSGGAAVRVALPLPVGELFDYTVPAALALRAAPGCRVQVRFRERFLTGVIAERGRGPDFTGELRPIERLVDEEPVLSPALLEVLSEAAREVFCPLGLALAAALPTGGVPRMVQGFALTPRGREALRAGALRGQPLRVLEALARHPQTGSALRRHGDLQGLRDLERDGLVVRRSVEQRASARAATVRVAALPAGLDLEAALAGELGHSPRQAALLRELAARGPVPVAALRPGFSAGLLRALAARGLVALSDRPAPRDVLGPPLEAAAPGDAGRPPRLSAEQAAALKPVTEAVRERRFETFLLHGVTGSGKTEVYLRAVGEALALGRQALVLVPEITLTHQILARLRARFGDNLAVLHSGLRPGERLEQWQRLRSGTTPIAVGARSALFAPLENLGVIAIDEEHDGAYKNEEGFRYHARDLAARRAARASCPLLLGSATPSLETRYAADQGRVRRLTLASRIGGRPLPAVEIVDLARERELAPRGRKIVLSAPLLRAMRETLAGGGQTILFLNRRGFSTKVFCFECGYAEHCPHCDIALVYHASEQALRCHYCDHRIPPPERCSGCGAPDTALLGLGTERLEEEVRRRFPEARIARLDRDSARRRGAVEGVLRALAERRLDVLIGTQMVAKGHDFPGVRLVGVVAADLGLHLPDFRAAERTFQLLTQVAGRAGRDAAPGRVVIQSFAPRHYAIAPVGEHDYERFYAEELGYRAALRYPPFGRLVQVLLSGAEQPAVAAAGEALARALEREGCLGPGADGGLERLGPAPAPLARLRGLHRVQLLVKGADEAPLRRAAQVLQAAAAGLQGGVQASLDWNPVNML